MRLAVQKRVVVRSRGADILLFARNFVRHPHMLGSIIPSSRFLVNAALAPIDWERARVIVEYGPGVGTLTAEILARMRSDATLVAIETNAEFVDFMREEMPDPRLRAEHDRAENVQRILARHHLGPADYIISGVPLGSMPKSTQGLIALASRDSLAADGRFLVYQFTSRVLPVLRQTFPRVQRRRELRNFPPAQLFDCAAG
jgi:phospholipid N-methyltransferase